MLHVEELPTTDQESRATVPPTDPAPPEMLLESATGPKVLVTLPVHNEATLLPESVELACRALANARINFTLAIAEDGSSDGSVECIQQLRRRKPGIVVQTNPKRQGRGWALRKLWSEVDAEFYAFSDVDFAAGPEFLVQAIRTAGSGAPIVTGSRYVPGATVLRPPLRSMVSRSYNWLIRLLFADQVRDHQCGLKVFRKDALRRLLPLSRENSWFWDTEMLVLAHEAGIRVTEIPVTWSERKTRRTKPLRLATDVYLHGSGILKLAGGRQARREMLSLGPPPVVSGE